MQRAYDAMVQNYDETLSTAAEMRAALMVALAASHEETSYVQTELQTMQNFIARQQDAIGRLKMLACASGADRLTVDETGKSW